MPIIPKIPVSGLYDNWAFTVDEIANLIFKAHGQDIGGRRAFAYGGTAEEALRNCIKKAERMDHPFRGFNLLRLVGDKIVETIGLLIRKFRGMED